jgi:hypothetical protein
MRPLYRGYALGATAITTTRLTLMAPIDAPIHQQTRSAGRLPTKLEGSCRMIASITNVNRSSLCRHVGK